jgi:hypothetical protein
MATAFVTRALVSRIEPDPAVSGAEVVHIDLDVAAENGVDPLHHRVRRAAEVKESLRWGRCNDALQDVREHGVIDRDGWLDDSRSLGGGLSRRFGIRLALLAGRRRCWVVAWVHTWAGVPRRCGRELVVVLGGILPANDAGSDRRGEGGNSRRLGGELVPVLGGLGGARDAGGAGAVGNVLEGLVRLDVG